MTPKFEPMFEDVGYMSPDGEGLCSFIGCDSDGNGCDNCDACDASCDSN